jgi:signal transduction histidine kinase/CheY-like chemotaxis protein
MFCKAMLKKTLKQVLQANIVFALMLQSIIYIIVFTLLFLTIQNSIASLTSLLSVIVFAWLWGRIAGCSVVIINTILTGISLQIINPEKNILFAMEPTIGLLIQFSVAIVTGTFSSMAKELRRENLERRNAEKKLIEYQNKLEAMVQKRTAELQATNNNLHQIEKLEVVGQLAAGIAHDFNNQLTVVLGYCELLNHHLAKNPELLSYLQQIHNSGKRAADLTRQLLAFARKGVYKMQVVNIHDIIKEIIVLLTHSVNKNIIIEETLNAKTPLIWGGANQIQNAILNLALNARDAMPDGGTLTFTTSTIEIDDEFIKMHGLQIHPGPYIEISVKDTGTGMEPDILKHLFEPFFTKKVEGKGTGMGLAAVYGIVNSHKGGIEVQSTPGNGSTFTLYFSETSKQQEAETPTQITFDKNRKLHVLIIDDEKQVAQTVKDIVNAYGVTVTLAFGGHEAVQIYKQNWRKIDLVIVDMMMPDMNGRQTFIALKKINPSIKAIISSGYTLNQEIELTLKAGASAFLQKPYNRFDLFQCIDTALNKTPTINTN